MKKEVWRAVAKDGFSGYEVSNLGQVRSWWGFHNRLKDVSRILKPKISNHGYQVLGLHKKDLGGKTIKRVTIQVHVLVLEAFVGPRPTLNGIKSVARHLDDNKLNNGLDNLKWGTAQENSDDALRNGRRKYGESLPQSKLTNEIVMEIREKYSTGKYLKKELAEEYGLPSSQITAITNNLLWKHLPNCDRPSDTRVIKSKKRISRGEDSRFSKLTDDKVREIRRLRNEVRLPLKDVGRIYEVSEATVSLIARMKIWGHVQ